MKRVSIIYLDNSKYLISETYNIENNIFKLNYYSSPHVCVYRYDFENKTINGVKTKNLEKNLNGLIKLLKKLKAIYTVKYYA